MASDNRLRLGPGKETSGRIGVTDDGRVVIQFLDQAVVMDKYTALRLGADLVRQAKALIGGNLNVTDFKDRT